VDPHSQVVDENGAPRAIRTPDLQIRSPNGDQRTGTHEQPTDGKREEKK
jgi:hypothetical protein